jgi:hypothetical protein
MRLTTITFNPFSLIKYFNIMKTIFPFILAFLLFHQALLGQSTLSVGIIGGPTIATFKGTSEFFQPKKELPFFSVGGALRIGFKKYFFTQTYLSYERKGFSLGTFKWLTYSGMLKGTSTINNHYNYGLLSQTVGFSTRGKIHFEGSIGAFGGYLIDMNSTSVFWTTGVPPFPLPDDLGSFNRFDWGATACVGIGFDLGKKITIRINAQENLGFARVYKSSYRTSDDKTFSKGAQLGVFYKI